MKKTLLLLLFVTGIQYASSAQVDVQINPVTILFEFVQLSVEFPFGSNGGVELDLLAGGGGVGLVGIGKYYMNPKYGADRFFIGGFLGAITADGDGGVGIGFIGGYKWLSAKGVNFELSLGAGRGSGGLLVFPYGKLAVGYRFGKKD